MTLILIKSYGIVLRCFCFFLNVTSLIDLCQAHHYKPQNITALLLSYTHLIDEYNCSVILNRYNSVPNYIARRQRHIYMNNSLTAVTRMKKYGLHI